MLDTDTKRRIDTARDILVGKVPDPKSQVEQITIALIYKFMDDMDAESEELGGKRQFFAGEFARYGWAKLMRSGLGGNEILNLYAEAIARMPENPGIPLLFRSIFKNAYLPYRDPETLKMFLKVIDEFEYDHSERLGDAFEYLLSVLGSQGDAGQFRTPRHIIDFIVEIVDPKKTDTVLDPACGTAGFLISSYKHILKANADDKGRSTLTPDEKGRLAENFKGYDISPDMVRLSLVNMYLHSFADPHIFEYDTLSSQERWGEYADVILANPPFMSPKGGIKPHNRFSVQSKRSEVLFVDYMAEHLTPSGRAGIIVPEGIIFQSQNAYTQLRKMLVEEYLVAVVSLPAGVFNPYSGVKTSILILDKSLAKQTATIAFFKVESDGFGLGAQRRPIDKNALPQARAEIAEYLSRLRAHESVEDFQPALGLVVLKDKIAANGDYTLSGERYQTGIVGQARFPMVPLGKVAELIRGITFGKADQLERATDTSLPVATTKAAQESGIVEDALYHIPRSLMKDDAKLLRPGDILISTANSLNLLGRTTHVRKVERPISFGAFMSVIRPNGSILDGYLIHCLRTAYAADFFLRNANTTTNISNLNLSTLAQFLIPLPPLEVQKEIVAEIEGYQNVIDGARAVVDNYHPHIAIHPDWPMVELGGLCELARGVTYTKDDEVAEGGHKVLRANNIDNRRNALDLSDVKHVSAELQFPDTKRLVRNDIFICLASGSKDHIGKVAFIAEDTDFYFGGFMGAVRCDGARLDPRYLFYSLIADRFNDFLRVQIAGANINNLGAALLARFEVPLPPLATQHAIVAELDAEQELVDANRGLIVRMEKKIQATLARVWGEDEPATPEA
jgi:type I restriction enzyme M protein